MKENRNMHRAARSTITTAMAALSSLVLSTSFAGEKGHGSHGAGHGHGHGHGGTSVAPAAPVINITAPQTMVAPATLPSYVGADSGASANAKSANANEFKSRALGLGLATAANPSTCVFPILGGLIQYRDVYCTLGTMGEVEAMIQLACQDPEMGPAIRAAGRSTCKLGYPSIAPQSGGQ